MSIDYTAIPTILDAVHLGLAAFAILLLILLLVASVKARTSVAANPVLDQTDTVAEKSEPQVTTSHLKETSPEAALQLLSLLQQDARFIDFIQEDLQSYSDADIGAAANWAQLLKTKLIHRLYRRGQIFHVEIDSVDAQVIDRWWIGRRIIKGALPLPQLDRRSVGTFTETDVLAFELD